MGAILGYATVGSNDLERAKAFYDPLLAMAGITPMFPHPTGGTVCGRDGFFCFGGLGPFDGTPAPARRTVPPTRSPHVPWDRSLRRAPSPPHPAREISGSAATSCAAVRTPPASRAPGP